MSRVSALLIEADELVSFALRKTDFLEDLTARMTGEEIQSLADTSISQAAGWITASPAAEHHAKAFLSVYARRVLAQRNEEARRAFLDALEAGDIDATGNPVPYDRSN